MSTNETFPHRKDTPYGTSPDCRCGADDAGAVCIGATWGENCSAALREALALAVEEVGRLRAHRELCATNLLKGYETGKEEARDAIGRLQERVVELEATIANERGEGEPPSEGWARNDIDPKREGVAWYVRWEADGSEPQEDDTEQTRVAWVRRTEGCMIEWMWEIEKSVGRMSDPMLASGRAPTARDAMIAADAARGGR